MQTAIQKNLGRFSLSVRVSLLLILATLLPLIITIASSELLSRPQLIAQANASMETDAQAHTQAIQNYFAQPIIDVRSLSQDTSLAQYLNGNADAAETARNVLITGYQRNTNYINWSLIDAKGKERLFYPKAASFHGQYLVPPATEQQLTAANQAAISSDYYNPQGDILSVDITEPVTLTTGTTAQVLGYLRVTLDINFIWNLVLDERNVNGSGSYAFIVDDNGVVIAHSDITHIFTAISPFSSSQQQNIKTLQRYGANTAIPVTSYSTLAATRKSAGNGVQAFEMVPPGTTNSYQVIGVPTPVTPWTYYVLSPTNVVTSLADQQLFNVGLIGLVVLLLAAIIGVIVGQRITKPILLSVTGLQSNSQQLKDMAAKEQVTVTEQAWVVDASKTGISSMNYYVDATGEAVNKILQNGKELEQHWPQVNTVPMREVIHQIVMAANYISEAVQYQKVSSKKLSAAIDLTQQVTDQLSASSESALQTAEQMEHVVDQLQQVVGKN